MFCKLYSKLTNITDVSCPSPQLRFSRLTVVPPTTTSTVPFDSPWSHNTWHSVHQINYRNTSRLPTRKHQLEVLSNHVYDVLVIGGGATGCGCALDAASRGLKTALLDASDFGNGASSKSSKLIHGGLRTLQAALKKIDILELQMLYSSLRERATIQRIAPHLVNIVPMLMPIDSYSDLIRYWLLLKIYDLLAGTSIVKSSHFLSAGKTHLACPVLSVDGDWKGSLVNYELQMDDARLCLALALTAARQGANIANYVHVQDLTSMDETGIRSVKALDLFSRRVCYMKAKCIINATGPFVDSLRRLDSEKAVHMAHSTAGTHIVLPKYFANSYLLHWLHPNDLFVMPWKDHALLGCTNGALGLEPKGHEVELLLEKFREKLLPEVSLTEKHVLSAWKGLWPSVLLPDSPISDRSILQLSEHKLLTIAGGNWTNYRAMAEDTIDKAVELANLPAICDCHTAWLPLEGAQRWEKDLPFYLAHSFNIPSDVAHHLASAYGTNAFTLLSTFDGFHARLHDRLPYIEAEILYAVLFEYAQTAVDVVARRMRAAFLDVAATLQMLPRVIELMTRKLQWSKAVQEAELHRTVKFLKEEMGMGTVSMCDALTNITGDQVKGTNTK